MKYIKKIFINIIITSIIMFSGCATIFDGTKQRITINSYKPMNISVGYASDDYKKIINPQNIKVPATITIRKSNKNLLLLDDNNKSKPIIIQSRVNVLFWAEASLLNIWGMTTDAADGAIWKYDDDIVTIPDQ
jgi:hypothetical protein